MKRMLACVMLIVLVVVFSGCSTSVNTKERYDSRKISLEERQTIPCKSHDTVVKIYASSLVVDLGILEDIDEVLYDDFIIDYYIESYFGNVIYLTKSHDDWLEISSDTYDPYSKLKPFIHQYVISPNNVFARSTTVYNAYLFYADRSHGDAAVYYVTDQGDYVLYQPHMYYDGIYLFPASVFEEFCKAAIDKLTDISEPVMGSTLDPCDYMDNAKSYEFHPMREKLKDIGIVIMIGVAVTIVSVVCVSIVRKKRKKKE